MEAMLQSAFSGALGGALVRLLNMSAAAGVLICVVVLLRALLRGAPKWTRCILWAIVAVQLVCPVSPRSPLSVYRLLPRSDDVKREQVEVFRRGGGSEKPLLVVGTPRIAGDAPGVQAQQRTEEIALAPARQAPDLYLPAAGAVWLSGCAAMLLYALFSYLTLRRRVRASVPLEGSPFRLCDGIGTPFILGVLRPRVYLPSGLSDAQRAAVTAHEAAHLRRGDHWWKLLGWLLLSVHWFNPLVWLAYVLLCRDIELACDERAVRDMDGAARADYSQALLDCAAPRTAVRVCPLAFGELGVKERIKAVLHYKKPAFWLIVLAVAVCVVVAVCFLTRPGPIEVPEGQTPVVTPTPHPTAAPDVPMYEGIRMESAKVYLLDDAFYPEKEPLHMFTVTIDADSGLFQYYETPISSYIGFGRFERDEDGILTIPGQAGRVNRFRIDEDGEKLVWLAEGSDNFTFIHLTDGATFSLDHRAYLREPETAEPRRMTLDDVLELSARGEALTWEALLQFEGEDVGSGLYIYRFPINEDYCLEASDGKLSGTPTRVLLVAAADDGTFSASPGRCVDIRTEDVAAFLARPRGPFLTVTSAGQSAAAAVHVLHERFWADDLHSWISGDGAPVPSLLERPERIPTLTLADDFELTFGGGAVRKSPLVVYDDQLTVLTDGYYGDTALYWLAPGTYYCGVEVYGPLGRYIEAEDAYEESVYLCVFRLVVPKAGPTPYTPREAHDLAKASLHIYGRDYAVTDADALAQLEDWLSHATELVGGAGCPFGSLLTLKRADGSEVSLCPAEDSCGTVFSDGRYYRYASDNAAFWALFGLKIQ